MSALQQVDINCDLGEGMGHDEDIMPFITSANIACGAHAGDEKTMRETLRLCKKYHVAAGAHPGYEDKENFGRVAQTLSNRSLSLLVTKQLIELERIAQEESVNLHHVKPHGALYNSSAVNKEIASAIAYAVFEFNNRLRVYGLAGSEFLLASDSIGLRSVAEIFADRRYAKNGLLLPRDSENALIDNQDDLLSQVHSLLMDCTTKTPDGVTVKLPLLPGQPVTICLHGDGPNAVEFARALHSHLSAQKVLIQAP